MRRQFMCGLAALAMSVLTACSTGGDDTSPRPSAPSARPKASAPSAPSAQDGADTDAATRAAAEQWLRSQPGEQGKDAPDERGFVEVRTESGSSGFVWQTRDDRFCAADVGGGFSVVTCLPHPIPLRKDPHITELGYVPSPGWTVLFAADHQEVTSATCAGAPVEVRRVETLNEGRRIVYAAHFTERRLGFMTVALRRGTASATARVNVNGVVSQGPRCG
ncbi:hypothetical protein FNH09_06580 [Streptomyces adustus]|uniref:Uncharacterized protein n=1 Tax=Streptomyces adustus TaxID=1609272 RepID=A0A5N8V724_9ACTN|nr:hypothetical protein [Streptomyces adustus]MPY30993.1 hypothetical protein [Streptomyces adustus]